MDLKKREGYALFLVLFFLSVIIAMAGVMYQIIFYAQRAKLLQRNLVKSVALAESALDLTLERLGNDPHYVGEKLELFGGSAVIEVSPRDGGYSVKIESVYPAADPLPQAVTLTAQISNVQGTYVYREKLTTTRLAPPVLPRGAPAPQVDYSPQAEP